MKRQHPKEVQELLGHSSVVTLGTCSHLTPDRGEADDVMQEALS
jgi:site-specific recombinase XerD